MEIPKPKRIQEKFLASEPLRGPVSFYTSLKEAIRPLVQRYPGLTVQFMGAESLVFAFADPRERNFVFKVNVASTIGQLLDEKEKAPDHSLEDLIESSREGIEKERRRMDDCWRDMRKTLKKSIVPTRLSRVMDVSLDQNAWDFFRSKAPARVMGTSLGATTESIRVPIIVTQQRYQPRFFYRYDLYEDHPWRDATPLDIDTVLDVAVFNEEEDETVFGEAFGSVFPSLYRRFWSLKGAVRDQCADLFSSLDAYQQVSRVSLDWFGSDNMTFVSSHSTSPLNILCLDPFLPRYSSERSLPDLSLMEKILSEVADPSRTRFTFNWDARVCLMVFYQFLALKGLCRRFGVKSQLTIQGMDALADDRVRARMREMFAKSVVGTI